MDDTSKRGKGRGRGRGRGRGTRKQTAKASREPESVQPAQQEEPIENEAVKTQPSKEEEKENEIITPTAPTIDMESDISQLEVTTFTTLSSRGPPEPMTKLKWNHKVSLIGEKVLNPMIHCCDQCEKPILIYGRMIPCKHVFCLKCAREEPHKMCPRCKEKVVRVEQSGLGTVFMCSHGGTRYGNTGCRRTYLSQRDLQAHINHRHVNSNAENKQPAETKSSNTVQRKPIEQPTSRQNTRQPAQFSSSISSTTQSSTASSSTVSRNNTMPPAVLQDNPLQSQPQQQQQPMMPTMMGNVHQQPQMAPVPEMYYTAMTQPQQYGGYAGAGQQQNQPQMQPNYGAMHQPPNPGMPMMMAQQAVPVHMSRPPPPQGPAYFSQYGQYGQMQQHYPNSRQYEQQNFNAPPNPPQWNQQQYYR